ncbi:MAG TPA: hypothetical protein VF592_01405 [Sphingomonas sp.]|jgi:hypothetical protein|uniref:hypothetical protein n=1 Tax=Sphingomonas sp. TaxID=28214 RepID=UPI002EDA8834
MTIGATTRPFRLGLFLLVWLSCAWFGSWEGNPNNATRLFAAVSLIEDGNATIDEFAPLTIDFARFGDHFYLDKAPGMTLMALPAVAAVTAATGVRSAAIPLRQGDPTFGRFMLARQWAATATGPAVLTAVAAVLLFDLVLGLTGRAGAALAASLAYALGSPIWGWSTTLFGHASVAALYVIAVWAIWRGTRDARARPGLALLAGAALGWAVVVEYQAVLAGSVIGAWALARAWPRPERWRLIGSAVAGGVAALVPLAVYNLVAFGTVFRLGYQGVVGWEGMNQGFFGLTAPSLGVLGEITVGPRRGLLWVAPVLLFAPIGLTQMWRERATRGLATALAVAAMVVLLVNASYFYWDGGNSTGPRHAMPVAGLLAIGLGVYWAALDTRAERAFVTALLALSIAINLMIAAGDVMAPPDFKYPLKQVVWDLRLARGQMFTVPSSWWGWSSWAGLALYLVVAGPLLGWLISRAMSERAPS